MVSKFSFGTIPASAPTCMPRHLGQTNWKDGSFPSRRRSSRCRRNFQEHLKARHICGQILRSGTAAAANYGEARGAESRADFIHKLKIVFKELNETTIWLEVIAESSLLFTGKHCRDCRGKPRTLSHYRRLYQDCPGVH